MISKKSVLEFLKALGAISFEQFNFMMQRNKQMAFRKFKVKVIREIEYEVSINEETYGDEEYNKKFSDVFWDTETLEDHVENVARGVFDSSRGFVEGYGYIHIDHAWKLENTKYNNDVRVRETNISTEVSDVEEIEDKEDEDTK